MLTTDPSPNETGSVFVPLAVDAIPKPICTTARPLLDPVLRPGTLTLVRGESGLGKSWLALSLAHAVANGRAVLDWSAPQAARVLYVDGALSPLLLTERLDALGKTGSLHLLSTATHGPLPDLGTSAGQDALERAMPSDLALLVLDDLTTLLRPGRGQGERLRCFSDWLLSLRRRGLAVLLLDGPRRVATSSLDAYADTKLALMCPKDWREEDGARFQIRLTARGFTGAAVRRFEARLDIKDGRAIWTRLAPNDDAALMAWRLHAEQRLSTRAIGRKLGVSRATAWRLLRRARALPEELRTRAAPEPLPGVEEAAQRAEATLARDPGLRRAVAWPEAHEATEVVRAAELVLLEAEQAEAEEAAKHPLDTPEIHAFIQAVLHTPPDALKQGDALADASGGEAVKQPAAMNQERSAPGGDTLPRPAAAGPASHRFAVRPRERARDLDRAASIPPLPLAGEGWGEGGAAASAAETVNRAATAALALVREAVKRPATPAVAPADEALKHEAALPSASGGEALKQPAASPPAPEGEAVKQPAEPPRIEELSTERLMELLLTRRRAYQAGHLPAPDELGAIAYHGLVCHARTRLGTRALNKRLAEEDAARQSAAPRRPRGFDVKHIPYPRGY